MMAERGSRGADGREAGTATPMPVPLEASGVVLFGGSFDPPTRAHVAMGVASRDAVAERTAGSGEVWLVFVPAGRSPFKGEAGASASERAEMLQLAIAGVERAAVWTEELDRSVLDRVEGSRKDGERAPSYWVETVQRAREGLVSGARLWFLIGADQAVAFHRWHRAREILALASPLVVLREPIAEAAALAVQLRATAAWSEEELAIWWDAVLPIPLHRGSATQARTALAARPPDRKVLERLLDPAVLDYICAHGLYTSR